MKMGCKDSSVYFSGENIVISFYLFVMLGFFPLFYKYQYTGMGEAKYKIFQYSTIACIVIFFLLFCIHVLKKILKREKFFTTERVRFSVLDYAVLSYFFFTTVSYLFSDFKKEGFVGASGWNMGYLTQLLFMAVYFLVSRVWKYQKGFVYLLLVSSAIVFLVAILHRFDVDALWIYGNLPLEYKVLFLSTMGQSSWYSSFLCTVFPIGLYLFYNAENTRIRFLTGIYSCIAMSSLVTQNTDSAFLSLSAVLLLLFYLSFDGANKMQRFLEVLLLISGSFTSMGIFQRLFAGHMIPLDKLSLFMTQSPASPFCFVLLAIIYVYIRKKSHSGNEVYPEKTGRRLFWSLSAVVGLAVAVTVVFIILNSTGFLYRHFGYLNENNYLLFNDIWGNARGFSWRFTCETYLELPFLRKLIGVGPDCFSFYHAFVPEYAQKMRAFWGELILTNAHNEYLTKLFNLGIFGLFSYIFMLGSGIYLFVKNRKESCLLPAFALCILSYMAHNIFCYEQVCCTPFLYVFLGMGSNLIHNKGKKAHTNPV